MLRRARRRAVDVGKVKAKFSTSSGVVPMLTEAWCVIGPSRFAMTISAFRSNGSRHVKIKSPPFFSIFERIKRSNIISPPNNTSARGGADAKRGMTGVASCVSEGVGVYTKNANVPAESTRAAAKKDVRITAMYDGAAGGARLFDDARKRMGFALRDGSLRDADEFRFFRELLEIARAHVSHADLNARHERRDDVVDGAFARDECFDALRYRFSAVREVAFLPRSAFDDGLGTHTAIFFEFSSALYDGLPRRLVATGEQIAEHDGRCAGRKRFRDIPRRAHAAVGDDGYSPLGSDRHDFENCGELGD